MTERLPTDGRHTPMPEQFTVPGAAGLLVGDLWQPDDNQYRAPLDEILMVHGGAQTRHSWNRVAARLASEGYRVTTYDSRGHGDSEWAPDGDYDITHMAADLESVVAQRFGDRLPVIVGASLGGLTGMYCLGVGQPVGRALVLVDVTPTIEAAGVERIGQFMRSGLDGFASLEEAAEIIAAYQPHRQRPINPDGLRKNLRHKADGRWYWHWDPRFIARASGENAELGNTFFTDLARRIEVPVLLIRGLRSDIVSDESVRRLKALIPHAHTHEVANAGHMVVGDDNAVFLDQLEWFLTDVVASEAGNS